ncbi:MAG: hypothetical protein IJ814_07570 [Paludibacteraceae bacterium]|nr:hypothetical protein [Paludibacteraceae bacterium]
MKPFIENTLAGTIGTVIGIVLTIGTTYLANKIETRRSEKQQIQMLVQGLEQNIKAFEEQAEMLEHADSLNVLVNQNWNDLSVLEDSTLLEWKNCLFNFVWSATDMTAARIFSSNIETWRNISSPEFIGYMGRCFSIIESLVEMNTRREDAFLDMVKEVYEMERKENYSFKSPADYCQHIIQQPAADDYMRQVHEIYATSFRGSTKLLREKLDESKQLVDLPVAKDEPQMAVDSITTQPDTLRIASTQTEKNCIK